jgi:hypothetical protein
MRWTSDWRDAWLILYRPGLRVLQQTHPRFPVTLPTRLDSSAPMSDFPILSR